LLVTIGAQHSSLLNGHVANLPEIHKQFCLPDHLQVKGSNQNQKKVEREACLNNLKLSSPPPQPPSAVQKDGGATYRVEGRRSRPQQQLVQRGRKPPRGSLENVSSKPLVGDFVYDVIDDQEELSLRRSRSLALIREDTFNSLEIPAAVGQQRRSQLIPRAKLIDRNLKDNKFLTKGKSQESIYSDLNIPKKRKSTKSESKETASEGDIYGEIDSFGPKSIDSSSLCHGTEKNFSYSEIGLSLPSYYRPPLPNNFNSDTNCETDISSLATSEDKTKEIIDFKRDELIQNNNLDSIPYDENIVLSKNTPLYDSIGDYYAKPFKPKTIRGNPLVYNPPSEVNTRSVQSTYDSDSTLSECINQDRHSEYVESDTNFDEIKLSNENIKLVHEDKVTDNVIYDSECSNIENNPIYDEITKTTHVKEKDKSYSAPDVTRKDLTWTKKKFKESPILRTFVKVPPPEDKESTTSSEEYKTIVSIETDDKLSSCFSSTNSIHESKKHSHNYLKEFLESQRGSRKPLQNFLSKRISRAFSSKPNLSENQYHSLPDISISKNLRKSEKIDRKLRKLEPKVPQETTNRFIVNIGRHFDVTAQSNVPVDFEVKISKISKSKQKEKKKPLLDDREKNFLEAVRTLKQTLGNNSDENQNLTKPEIVAVKTKHGINQEITNLSKRRNGFQLKSTKQQENNKIMEKVPEKPKTSVEEEYQEKVGTIRNYWDKILSGNDPEKSNENKSCKIVEVKTKIDEVKKKFEQEDLNEIPSKVQLAKKIFEKSSKNDRNEKYSTYIKECRDIFENPYFERDHQYESLNPNIVEIVDKKREEKNDEEKQQAPNSGNHKPVFKSKSVIEEPEFDHVRYRVLKSDVFQKKIYANCEKESQFEGLMQYLQDFSFHELLIDNNIVIIEPIRTNVKFEPKKPKTTRNVTPLIHNKKDEENEKSSSLKRRFFYHPIRVNREVNDNELPNPDTVKQVRELFEAGLIRSQSTKELADEVHSYKTDPDKDRCSTTETNSSTSVLSDYGSNENLFESIEDMYYDTQYVSEDILEKIRDQGTSITYYGGRILNKYNGKSDSLTKAIMDEIRKNQTMEDCNCKKIKTVTFIENEKKDSYKGIKFRLLKSNSCSSRLELVGTKNNHNQDLNQNLNQDLNHNLSYNQNLTQDVNQDVKKDVNHNGKQDGNQNVNEDVNQDLNQDCLNKEENFIENSTITLKNNSNLSLTEKNNINENIKIKENESKTGNKIKNNNNSKLQFDYNLEGVRKPPKNDMEFEPYEIADN
ncbi:protein javelin, partial [Onthophagus taurus]|uniref:protein javelin n=1 Tax=Onthophagus taurus TaxID=166361 RepID=UPI0039BE481F